MPASVVYDGTELSLASVPEYEHDGTRFFVDSYCDTSVLETGTLHADRILARQFISVASHETNDAPHTPIVGALDIVNRLKVRKSRANRFNIDLESLQRCDELRPHLSHVIIKQRYETCFVVTQLIPILISAIQELHARADAATTTTPTTTTPTEQESAPIVMNSFARTNAHSSTVRLAYDSEIVADVPFDWEMDGTPISLPHHGWSAADRPPNDLTSDETTTNESIRRIITQVNLRIAEASDGFITLPISWVQVILSLIHEQGETLAYVRRQRDLLHHGYLVDDIVEGGFRIHRRGSNAWWGGM